MYVYVLILLALTTMLFLWNMFRLVKISGDISDAMKDLDPALEKRNVTALDLIRTSEKILSPENPLVDNIRKYGRLSAGASSFKEKILNVTLFQNSLSELLTEMSDHHHKTVREPGFISSYVELLKIEEVIDARATRYNSLLLRFNGMLSGPLMNLLARMLKMPEMGFFPEKRSPLPKIPTIEPVSRDRDLADVLISNIDTGAAIKCRCGLEIKIPPDFKEEKIFCQMCGESHEIPSQLTRATEAMLKGHTFLDPTRRTAGIGRGWGSLRCTCGNVIQLSPGFEASYVKCFSCGRKIMSGTDNNEKPVPVSTKTK
jgi:hypothetical protein